MKYKRKEEIVEAVQWFKNGDHPKDNCKVITPNDCSIPPFLSEGLFVRRYNHPFHKGNEICEFCGNPLNLHGWIDNPKAEDFLVCPGSWIIDDSIVMGDAEFKNTYEPIEESVDSLALLMMEPIKHQDHLVKFRAWISNGTEENELAGEMIEWNPEFFSDRSPVTAYSSCFPEEDGPVILMQYIGIRDKNGKDIYEGDIIKVTLDEIEIIGEVIRNYDLCLGGLGWHLWATSVNDGSNRSGFIEMDWLDNVEIIGNVYEN